MYDFGVKAWLLQIVEVVDVGSTVQRVHLGLAIYGDDCKVYRIAQHGIQGLGIGYVGART